MNWDQIEGNWKQFKGEAQTQWGKLTNDDLDVVQGKTSRLFQWALCAGARLRPVPVPL